MTFDPFADPADRFPSASIDAPAQDTITATVSPYGPLEAAVRGDVEALGLVSSTARSLAELAYNLARKLDDGAGMATAAVAKELRETLEYMAEQAGDDDGAALLDRLSQPADLPSPVRDPAQP